MKTGEPNTNRMCSLERWLKDLWVLLFSLRALRNSLCWAFFSCSEVRSSSIWTPTRTEPEQNRFSTQSPLMEGGVCFFLLLSMISSSVFTWGSRLFSSHHHESCSTSSPEADQSPPDEYHHGRLHSTDAFARAGPQNTALRGAVELWPSEYNQVEYGAPSSSACLLNWSKNSVKPHITIHKEHEAPLPLQEVQDEGLWFSILCDSGPPPINKLGSV